MNWRSIIAWWTLAALIGLLALGLTRWITAVHFGSAHALGIVFDERPPGWPALPRLASEGIVPQRRVLPRIVITNYNELLLVVTPATQSMEIVGVGRDELSCGALQEATAGASVASMVEGVKRLPLEPVTVARGDAAGLTSDLHRWAMLQQIPVDLSKQIPSNVAVTHVSIPAALEVKIRAHRDGQGVFRCQFKTPLTASPTFTDRAVTILTPASQSGVTLLDVSALANVHDLRFFGGIVLPWEGDRTRAFDKNDQLVSVEWADISAEEQKDVILVIIGALFAIAAATVLEAARPIVEHLARSEK